MKTQTAAIERETKDEKKMKKEPRHQQRNDEEKKVYNIIKVINE